MDRCAKCGRPESKHYGGYCYQGIDRPPLAHVNDRFRPAEPPVEKKARWLCGRCEQERMIAEGKNVGEMIPGHSRHCPKRAAQPPVGCLHERVTPLAADNPRFGESFARRSFARLHCTVCLQRFELVPASQWAAVMGLPGILIREAQEKEEMGCTHPEWEDGPRQSVYGVAAGLRASAEELRKVLELEQVTEGPANIIGRWPGDESDEEVNEALEELS